MPVMMLVAESAEPLHLKPLGVVHVVGFPAIDGKIVTATLAFGGGH